MRKGNHSEKDYLLELLGSGFYQTTKDYTECFGTMTALLRYMGKQNLQFAFREHINIYIVGDGRNPQMGLMLARKLPFAIVWSIDPELKYENGQYMYPYKLASNQKLFKGTIQDFDIPADKTIMSIIVGVHNHGPIQNLWDTLKKTSDHILSISLPCCFTDANLSEPADLILDDPDIISPKRTLYLWYENNTQI